MLNNNIQKFQSFVIFTFTIKTHTFLRYCMIELNPVKNRKASQFYAPIFFERSIGY